MFSLSFFFFKDESDNIYSRHYVPGSMTRQKEEELGSPTAILESRRQFALQQRQNKGEYFKLIFSIFHQTCFF